MKLTYLAMCLLALGACCIAAPADSIDSKLDADYRLPSTVLPIHYEIFLEPFLLESDGGKRFTFDGEVFITLKAAQAGVKTITLHKKEIDITTSQLYEANNKTKTIAITLGDLDPVTDKMDITLNTELNAAIEYTLTFKYTGKLGDDMHGFYKSNYINENKEEVWIGSTQFQTNHARRAFPSFDEPKFKATFQIEITHPMQYNVVSNTLPEAKTKITQLRKMVTLFKKTPVMSTYLVAFLVSDFRVRGSSTDFQVLARPDAYSQTEYAHSVGPKLLEDLDKFTGFAYTNHGLGKMHLAAIPDFSAGAMENWGLLTYRETALLFDSTVSTALSQQRIASVISHELGHMWFGDLVTCDWWGYTWLNEGFGRYFQYFTTNAVENTWELDKQFVVEQVQSVMNMDSLAGTTPMSDPSAASPADLARMFNSISYNKGATIIRMVKHMMTEDKFKLALQAYLKAHAFKTSVPQKLFDAFDAEWSNTAVNMTSLLMDWTEQVGYPVVTITRAADRKSFKVSQKRFLLREDAGDANILWTIPFTYTTDAEINFANTVPTTFLEKNTGEKVISLAKEANWIIGNIQETGYYRVNYDKDTWANILKSLNSDNHGGIHELNRAQIVDDVFNFGRSALIDYNQMIDILYYLRTETNYLPWYSAFSGFSYLATRLGNTNEKVFGPYILDLLETVYNSVGFKRNPNELRLVTYNRASVLAWACKYGHSDCIKDSKAAFKALTDDKVDVEVNIRSVVYCTAIRQGNASDFDYLWQKFKTENVASEQVLILTALGCSTNAEQLNSYLDKILSSEVRLQDKLSAFQGTFTSYAENVQVVYEYVAKNYKNMFTAFKTETTVGTIMSNIASRFTTVDQQQAFETFVKDNGADFNAAKATLETAVTNVKFNLEWSKTAMKPFLEHLVAKANSATSLSISTLLLFVSSYLVSAMLR